MSLATSSKASCRLPKTTMLYPLPASCLANSSPMPEVAPVTRAQVEPLRVLNDLICYVSSHALHS